MAITANHLVTNRNAVAASSFVTASITPTFNRLVLATVCSVAGAAPNTPTLTGNGMTWVLEKTLLDTPGNSKVSIFRSLLATPPSAGAVTIDFAAQSQQACGWSITEFAGVDTSGSSGGGAIAQSVSATTAAPATTATVTLAAFSNLANVAYGGFMGEDNASTFTAGTGFTIAGQSTGVVALTVMSEYQLANATTVNCGYNGTHAVLGIAAEIKTSAGDGWGIVQIA